MSEEISTSDQAELEKYNYDLQLENQELKKELERANKALVSVIVDKG